MGWLGWERFDIIILSPVSSYDSARFEQAIIMLLSRLLICPAQTNALTVLAVYGNGHINNLVYSIFDLTRFIMVQFWAY